MVSLDFDYPCHELFLCDPSLDCDSRIEHEFYLSRVQPSRLELCHHCAGVCESPISMNTHLKARNEPYSVVLPICRACSDGGCPIIVQSALNNAKAKEARLEKQNAREASSNRDATTIAAITIYAFATTAPTTCGTLLLIHFY